MIIKSLLKAIELFRNFFSCGKKSYLNLLRGIQDDLRVMEESLMRMDEHLSDGDWESLRRRIENLKILVSLRRNEIDSLLR